jgi:hypothetical protein
MQHDTRNDMQHDVRETPTDRALTAAVANVSDAIDTTGATSHSVLAARVILAAYRLTGDKATAAASLNRLADAMREDAGVNA